MRLVVADTGPLHYLVLTGDIELLPTLFDRVLVPEAVRNELPHTEAPAAVRAWIAQAPAWLDVRPHPDTRSDDITGSKLDDGNRARAGRQGRSRADGRSGRGDGRAAARPRRHRHARRARSCGAARHD